MKIVFLTDFHVGSHSRDPERLRIVVSQVAKLEPDLVLLGGDFLNMMPAFGGRVPPEIIAERLGPLKIAPLGAWAVLGNHDWEYGYGAVTAALTACDIPVMRNEAVLLKHRSTSVHLAGVDDYATNRGRLQETIRDVPNHQPLIILTHDPAAFADLEGRSALVLAGHTHGGQVVLPFFGPVVNASVAPLTHTYGHIVTKSGSQMIVSSGLGTSGLPLRLGTWPEIVEVTLQN
ncbi:MAG: metallophosphoesterase [Stappiaceae bacterium]